MAMVLYSGELIAAARESGVPDVAELERKIVEANKELAIALARHLNIKTGGANYDMGTVGASFFSKESKQPCPDVIAKHDEGGDWRPLALALGRK